jgi:aconitate hydratase
LTFKNAKDYDRLEPGDELVIKNVTSSLKKGEDMEVENKTRGFSFPVSYELSDRQVKILLAGGLLNYTKKAQG